MLSRQLRDLLIKYRAELVSSIVVRESFMADLIARHVITDEDKENLDVSCCYNNLYFNLL